MKSTIAASALMSSLVQGVQVKSKQNNNSIGQSLAQLKAPEIESSSFDDSTPSMEELTFKQREEASEDVLAQENQQDNSDKDIVPSSNSFDPSEVVES